MRSPEAARAAKRQRRLRGGAFALARPGSSRTLPMPRLRSGGDWPAGGTTAGNARGAARGRFRVRAGCVSLSQSSEALLAKRNPLRERLRGAADARPLPLRSTRQRRSRPTRTPGRRSSEELGIEPSSELQELEQAILRQDPELAAAASLPRGARSSWRFRTNGRLEALLALAGAARAATRARADRRARRGRRAAGGDARAA